MPPEDEPGDGTPSPVTDRKSALAARIDAMLDADDDDGEGGVPTPAGSQDAVAIPAVPPAEVQSELSEAAIDLEELEEVEPVKPPPPTTGRVAIPPPPVRIPPPVPPRPPIAIPPAMPNPTTGRIAIPPMRASTPAIGVRPPVVAIPPPVVAIPAPAFSRPATSPPEELELEPLESTGVGKDPAEPGEPELPRAKRPSVPPPEPELARAKRPSVPPPPPPVGLAALHAAERPVSDRATTIVPDGDDALASAVEHAPPPPAPVGLEIGTAHANIVVDQPLEAMLESPTIVDRALAELGDAGGEARANAMLHALDETDDAQEGAMLAYELGELYERRLADEARGVKAYNRALALDPSLRPNLWAIRRVFYRRGLWPNLAKLIAAEVDYATDDLERADLLLEKARILGHHLDDAAEARVALEEAAKLAPQHQGVLLELERVLARAGDRAALLEVWEALAEAVEQPARKIAYWLEVGRAATAGDFGRAVTAFEHAARTATVANLTGVMGERIARERLRVAEEHGGSDDIVAAIAALRGNLLATFGVAGPGAADAGAVAGERATHVRRELVALHRRQAQLAQQAGEPERAWDTLQEALALAPGEPVVLADLTELAEELGRYDDLAELVQSWQAVEGDPARAMVLSIRRADALLRGGQRDQARALLASLEASAPGFVVLTSAAERDALGREDAGDLAKAYLAAAHAALLGTWLGPGQPPTPAPRAAAALFVQAAELLAYDVATPEAIDEARAALAKALEAIPDHPAAAEALTALDDATGRVGDALARLRAQAAATPEPEARRAVLERAIRLARGHGELDAVLALEQAIAELAPAGDPEGTAARWRIEATLAQLGRDDERAVLLGELASREADATRRGTALLAAARLRERAGAVEQATELYRQVLALWPDDGFARESLVDLLRAQERWTELVTERRAEARALPDGPAARRALREAAWVLEVRQGDLASAAAVYSEWLGRYPDDRVALEGAARCRAQFGDRGGEVAARQGLADLDRSAETQWLLARAFERAGQFDEAADVYRALGAHPEPGVAATAAALGLADLAAGRADNVMRVEATALLAQRTQDPRLGAALAEDSGWMYALVLEDFDRAAQSFAAAIALEPARRGALLGQALVAARLGEARELAGAYEGLAKTIQMPEAAAALHLRAAAMAAAAGDLELANARVLAARAAAPDDASALLVAAESPHVPETGNAAIDPLLSRAEVLEMRAALADDPSTRNSWELDRADALEQAGRLREAATVVVAVLGQAPDDLRGLATLRRLADRAGDKPTWGRASLALARVLGDRQAKLALLRDAAAVFDAPEGQAGADRAAALSTYRRIVTVDPSAKELDRLLEMLRERADVRGLIGVLTDKLTWLGTDDEGDADANARQMVPLLLERAMVLFGLGDHPAAIADLDALLERAPANVEALRFRGDLAMAHGDIDTAIAMWRRYLEHETRAPRRTDVELQLSQVLAENAGDIAGAIENLEHVVEQTPDDVALRERLLGLCIRANDAHRAARELKQLVRLRTTPADKAREELRLALLQRDKLGDRGSARMALDRARMLDPLNLDVVRELVDMVDGASRTQALASAATSLRSSIVQAPGRAVLYDRLAQVAAWQSDVDARWLALVAFEALGMPSSEQKQVLAQGRASARAPQRVRLAEPERAALRGPGLGVLGELWRAVAPSVQVTTGVDAGKLGFGRGDKLALKKLGDRYEPLATALAAYGLEDVEIYVSAQRAGIARALAGETPVLCLGADVAAAATPNARFLLGRAVAAIAEGVTGIADLRDGELPLALAAAIRASDATVPPALAEQVVGEDNALAERTRVLKKELPRKAKNVLAQLASARGAELGDVLAFRRAAITIGNRAGLAWCGDLAVALALLDVGKGGKALLDSPAALDLVAWSVSGEHHAVRGKLGVALGGTR